MHKDLEWQFPDVDLSGIARRAIHGDVLPCFEHSRGAFGAYDAWDAELARHDRRMARPPALIRDDRGSDLHDRFPVGVGHFRHQYFSFPELIDLFRTFDDPRAPGSDPRADRSAGEHYPPASVQPVLL